MSLWEPSAVEILLSVVTDWNLHTENDKFQLLRQVIALHY